MTNIKTSFWPIFEGNLLITDMFFIINFLINIKSKWPQNLNVIQIRFKLKQNINMISEFSFVSFSWCSLNYCFHTCRIILFKKNKKNMRCIYIQTADRYWSFPSFFSYVYLLFSTSAVLRYSDQHVIALCVCPVKTYVTEKYSFYLQIYCKMYLNWQKHTIPVYKYLIGAQIILQLLFSNRHHTYATERIKTDSSAFMSRISRHCSDSSIYSIA